MNLVPCTHLSPMGDRHTNGSFGSLVGTGSSITTRWLLTSYSSSVEYVNDDCMFGENSRHYTSNQQKGSRRNIIPLRSRGNFNSIGHIAIGNQIVRWRMKRGQRMLLTVSFIADIEHCDTHDEHYVCATQIESIGLTSERSCASLSGGKCGERTRPDLPGLPHLNLWLRASAFCNRPRLF